VFAEQAQTATRLGKQEHCQLAAHSNHQVALRCIQEEQAHRAEAGRLTGQSGSPRYGDSQRR
jgi:hypothetical protein